MEEKSELEKTSRKFIHDIKTPVSVLNMLSSLFETEEINAENLNILKEELAKIEKLIESYSQDMKSFYAVKKK